MSKPEDLVQGTLDLLLLKIVALEPLGNSHDCSRTGADFHGPAQFHRSRGGSPFGSLVMERTGSIYGVATYGGNSCPGLSYNSGCGVVSK